MGRWQLVQAILMFAGAPLYLLFLLAAATAAAIDLTSPFPVAPTLALATAWPGALYAPKLLGYAEVALCPDKRARYGGLALLVRGAVAEFGVTLLLDGLSAVAKSVAMFCLALGARAEWLPQNRSDRGVTWGEAARLLWPQTLLGVLAFACFASAGWMAILLALPLAGGLLAAIPLCVLTADRRIGKRLRAWQVAAIPEEIAAFPASPSRQPLPQPGEVF
jgi:membrane glycosyltransferase